MVEIREFDQKYLKLYLNGQEIGFLEYTLAADEAQIIDVFVQEASRGQGYGTKLLEKFLQITDKRFSYIVLEVRESNAIAIKLYQKFGFVKIDLRQNYYQNPLENALILKKELK